MANKLHLKATELTSAQKQQVALNAVLEAGKTVAGACEKAMTSASKNRSSYPRYINDILVNRENLFRRHLNNAAKSLGDFMKKIGE